METLSPESLLSPEDRKSLSLVSFPDSNNLDIHTRLSYVSTFQTAQVVYYCYVRCIQIRHNDCPRGYFQKSVVILTRMPLVTLYLSMAANVAEALFYD